MEDLGINLQGEMATLTTKLYTMKTTLFEQQNDFSAMKSEQEILQENAKSLELDLVDLGENSDIYQTDIHAIKTDLNTLRTGLTSLTNSLFNLKTQVCTNNIYIQWTPLNKPPDNKSNRLISFIISLGQFIK